MILTSSEKLKKHITNTSILTIILNLFIGLIALLNLIGLIYVATQSDSQLSSNYDSQTLAAIRQAQTFGTYAQAILVLALYLVIAGLLIRNLRRLKKGKSISLLPYYLGFVLTLISLGLVLYSIAIGQTSPHISNFVAPVLFSCLYGYGYQCSKTYLG
ncbi:hypothetical protein [Streptococcus loxodontisalivarius]|uniref:Membrane protein n=1 Tax=Streptococcus loxodontisalivarius TaxID=1349415 RepID=A0ABS2PS22_9STRE|nr:hypothetical protein [Streptococcus loxodontisalivarius]MBM7642505.1 putative membrane protein [Streptococcus loxodontisalivarius]